MLKKCLQSCQGQYFSVNLILPKVNDEDRDITVFVTRHRLFRWKVMPFGIVSAPAVFTRMMRKLLQGLNQVVNYIDDILIYTETWEEHVEILELVNF